MVKSQTFTDANEAELLFFYYYYSNEMRLGALCTRERHAKCIKTIGAHENLS